MGLELNRMKNVNGGKSVGLAKPQKRRDVKVNQGIGRTKGFAFKIRRKKRGVIPNLRRNECGFISLKKKSVRTGSDGEETGHGGPW
jgi:hypothetical protein